MTSSLFSAFGRCLLNHRHLVPRQTFHSSSVDWNRRGNQVSAPKFSKAGEILAKECEERTRITLIEERKSKQLYTPPKFSENISELFNFFPMSPEVVESALLDNQEILKYNARTVVEFIKILVECGDFELITQEEALLFIARVPEILKIDKAKFKEQVSNMFGLTALYDIPWNKVMLASPHTFTLHPQHVSHVVEHLALHFDQERIRDVIGNNPELLEIIWYDTEAKIKYLQKTMNVSAYRIAMTPKSLTCDMEFLQLRYQFLLRSGNYRHPDPSAKSALPAEASPALHLITDTDDARFVYKCCPGLTVEEFNIFKSLMLLENDEHESVDDDYSVEDDFNDDNVDNNSYTVLSKGAVRKRGKNKKLK